jgi:hypothetical protein
MTTQRTARTYGVVPPETMASMAGLDLLRGMIEGRFSRPADHAARRL